jgi:alanyl aminopeptidase
VSARFLALAIIAGCGHHDPPRLPPPPHPAHADAGIGDATSGSLAKPGLRLPEGITPTAYDLRLELDPELESFRGTVEIHVRLDKPAEHVWLHSVDLEISAASYRAAARSGLLTALDTDPDNGMEAFGFGGVLPAGDVTLVFEYTGHTSRNDEGLFRQQAAGHWFLFAQSESMFARRILPCFDEPRWKPAWRVTLVVPGKLVALGNGGVASDSPLPDNHREVKLAEVASMASYLFSVAVGPFVVVDAGRVGRGRVPVRVAVAPGSERRAGVAAAKLPAIVDALERYADQAMPLAKLDLVAVPHFFGAMENVGLITFETSILVGDAKAPAVGRRFTRFAAHELAHQWFGNLVTPAWWDDLWLSEGFATWLGDKIAAEVGAYEDPMLSMELARLHALDADRDADPRPLRRAIATTDDADDRFDAIAYEKGGAVLAMFERFVGADKFRDAARTYLRERGGRTATSNDFVAALGAATSPAVASALAAYLDRPGAPVVEIELSCKQAPELVLRARDGATVPVCVRHAKGTGSTRTCAIATANQRVALSECPAWLVGNEAGAGYYHVASPSTNAASPSASAPLTAPERLARADDLSAALLRSELPLPDALRELRALAGASDAVTQLAAVSIAGTIDPLVDDTARAAWSRWLAARFAPRLGKAAMLAPRTPVESELRDRLAQLVASDQFDATTVAAARWIVDRALAIDRAPPDFALALAAPRGGRALFDRIVAVAAKVTGERQEALLEALGAFGPELAPRLVELVVDGKFRPAHVWAAVAAMLGRAETRTAAWRAVHKLVPRIFAQLAEVELPAMFESVRPLCDATARAEVAASFASKAVDVTGKNILTPVLAAIDRCITHRAKLGDVAAAVR